MLETYYNKDKLEVGVDEAGAGCLAGPVYAAAVIWPTDLRDEILNHPSYNLIKDSKTLNKKKRESARQFIIDNCSSYSIQSIDHSYIDDFNILNARIKAMHKCIDDLLDKNIYTPDLILVDGNRFNNYTYNDISIEHKCFVKGDNKFISIAAASILAKTARDEFMVENAHQAYPHYHFDKHKGYATKKHYEAIKTHGVCPIHRLSFRLN